MDVPSIFLNRVLAEAVKKRASNLHLTVGSVPIIRVDDRLIAMDGENIITSQDLAKIIDSFASVKEKQELENHKEVVLAKDLASGFRFRINIFYQKGLPAVTFYYISKAIKNLSDLKLPDMDKVIKLNSGLFIITGAYSSGKTNTAAAIIEEVNKNYKKNIITIENPIEYLFVNKESMVSQRQVGRDVESVIQGLRHCLAEDADLVYVGKIKKEFEGAIPIILELAAGNSLVVLEINANSAVRTIEKIVDSLEKKMSAQAARYNLADVLLGIVVQKLIPRVGGGLVLAHEVLLATGAVKSLIREGKIYQIDSIIQTSRQEGMISMKKSIEELVRGGIVKQENI